MPDVSGWLKQLTGVVERAALDPPHRAAGRIVGAALKSGLVGEFLGGSIAASVEALVEEGMNAGAIHRIHAANHPERRALVDAHRELNYREADAEIDRLAGALDANFGCADGGPVAMMMENRSEYVAAWFATFRLETSGVHVSYRATPEELAYQLEHSGARVVLCSERTRPVVEEVIREHPELEILAVDCDAPADAEEQGPPEMHSYRRLLEATEGWRARQKNGRRRRGDAEPGANIVYTSGTTGQPKGTLRNFTTLGLRDLSCILARLPVEAADEHLVVTPIYHSGGQVFTLLNAALGATVHLQDDFEPADTLELLSERGINSLFLVPTMIRRLLELPDAVHRANPTPELRVLISGAAPFPEALRRRAIQRFGAPTVHDFYGATELGWVTLIDGLEMLEKPGSVGRPIPGQEVQILDDDGRECGPEEVGQIWVRSLHSMSGYLRDEEANEAFRRDGWVTVEDLGYLDEDGYLFLAGRSRDMVITGGVNVYPVEIEDALVEHPAVADVGVVGLSDEEWGERLAAFVQPADGEAAPESEALEAWVRDRLAGYKVPREWHILDALPRNETGKIEKTKLEEQYG